MHKKIIGGFCIALIIFLASVTRAQNDDKDVTKQINKNIEQTNSVVQIMKKVKMLLSMK
jgi:hypothetical protein